MPFLSSEDGRLRRLADNLFATLYATGRDGSAEAMKATGTAQLTVLKVYDFAYFTSEMLLRMQENTGSYCQ